MTNAPVKGSTQEFVEIEDIKDDIVLMRDGSCALIIETTAVNFGLLSKNEQDAIIFAYAALLNSLSFPIQIVIQSRRINVSSYISSLDEKIALQQNQALHHQMELYRNFVLSTIKENDVLDKKFYIVIPFSRLELGLSGAFSMKKGLPLDKKDVLDRARHALYPKRDHILRQLSHLSLKASVFSATKLATLFFELFNPGQEDVANIAPSIHEYFSSQVEPKTSVQYQSMGAPK